MRWVHRKQTTVASTCVAVGLTLVLTAGGGPVRADQRGVPSTDRLVTTAIDYVRNYQELFKFLVADETSVQQVVVPFGLRGEPSLTRTTRGEMFITYLAAERQWTAVHDVADVDGFPLAHREDLAALLSEGTFATVAPRLFASNARYNIGATYRNFNDPMLALLMFSSTRRSLVSFSRKSVDASHPDVVVATLAYRERDRPTIVHDRRGRSVFARGEVVMEAATGVLRKTTLTIDADDVTAELTTEFTLEPRLELWVPAVFTERYTAKRDGRVDVTACESRYSNYRRFAVTGRFRPSP